MVNSCYIHIPFCKNICSYCDFCKIFYNDNLCHKYLGSLKKEIIDNYKGEPLSTLYIGGGTPSSLSMNNIEYLFDIIKLLDLSLIKEFTFECNVLDINDELLKYLKDHKVNRISIGVETINEKGQKFLNRVYSKNEVTNRINLVKKYFDNINIDLIYAYKDEDLNILKEDLDFITMFDPSHISCYSLIIEEHTKIFNDRVTPIDEELDSEMFFYINKYLLDKGYNHIEISNYAKDGYLPLHNLVYWNNEHYYGFGAGASGYIDNIRYSNTRNVFKYIEGSYDRDYDVIDLETGMENEIMLGLRKIDGISIDNFKNKFGKDIYELFDIDNLIKIGYISKKDGKLFIPHDKLYVSNSIIVNFIGGRDE